MASCGSTTIRENNTTFYNVIGSSVDENTRLVTQDNGDTIHVLKYLHPLYYT